MIEKGSFVMVVGGGYLIATKGSIGIVRQYHTNKNVIEVDFLYVTSSVHSAAASEFETGLCIPPRRVYVGTHAAARNLRVIEVTPEHEVWPAYVEYLRGCL